MARYLGKHPRKRVPKPKRKRRPRPPKQMGSRNYNLVFKRDRREGYLDASGNYVHQRVVSSDSKAATLTVSNPWRAAKPKGLRPPTARSLVSDVRIYGYGTIDFKDGSIWRRHTGPTQGMTNLQSGLPTPPPGIYSQLRTEAIFDAMSKVKAQQFNAGIALAESEGVVQMIYDFGTVIGEVRSLIRQRKFKAAYREFRGRVKGTESYPSWRNKNRHILRQSARGRAELRKKSLVPQTWLYYHFGIKPTVDDINTGINQICQGAINSPYDFGGNVTGYAKDTQKEEKPHDLSTSGRQGTLLYNLLRSIRVVIHVTPKSSFLSRMSKFGVTNIPEALYNRLPFSWVADYFSTLGDFVSNLDSGLGWNIATEWTESFRIVHDCTYRYEASADFRPHYGLTPDRWKYKSINRLVVKDLYGPMGTVLPSWKRKGPSANQIANLVSVIALLFTGGSSAAKR